MTASIAALFPDRARAFWPFSTNVSAASNHFTPVSSTPVLEAAVNSDPNPNKGLGDAIQTSGNKALLAYSGPSGTIADVASSTSPDTISVYVVRPGDTLSEIADMFNVSKNTIIWANNLKGVNDVHPGDTLIILPVSGVERIVVKGDTLKYLAKKYGVDESEIVQYNGLDAKAPLEIGSTIIIPGGEISVEASTPVKHPGSTASSQPHVSHGPFIAGYYSNPLPGGIITQGLHDGTAVDIGAARGTPIYAAADGTAIIVRNNGGSNGGYGNYVVISHSNGTQTLYAHMKSAIVSSGQQVSGGQMIGYVGMTGRTTGPHLHFEVRGAMNPFRNCAVGSVCSPQ